MNFVSDVSSREPQPYKALSITIVNRLTTKLSLVIVKYTQKTQITILTNLIRVVKIACFSRNKKIGVGERYNFRICSVVNNGRNWNIRTYVLTKTVCNNNNVLVLLIRSTICRCSWAVEFERVIDFAYIFQKRTRLVATEYNSFGQFETTKRFQKCLKHETV